MINQCNQCLNSHQIPNKNRTLILNTYNWWFIAKADTLVPMGRCWWGFTRVFSFFLTFIIIIDFVVALKHISIILAILIPTRLFFSPLLGVGLALRRRRAGALPLILCLHHLLLFFLLNSVHHKTQLLLQLLLNRYLKYFEIFWKTQLLLQLLLNRYLKYFEKYFEIFWKTQLLLQLLFNRYLKYFTDQLNIQFIRTVGYM